MLQLLLLFPDCSFSVPLFLSSNNSGSSPKLRPGALFCTVIRRGRSCSCCHDFVDDPQIGTTSPTCSSPVGSPILKTLHLDVPSPPLASLLPLPRSSAPQPILLYVQTLEPHLHPPLTHFPQTLTFIDHQIFFSNRERNHPPPYLLVRKCR